MVQRLTQEGNGLIVLLGPEDAAPEDWSAMDSESLLARDRARWALLTSKISRFNDIAQNHKDRPWADALLRVRALLRSDAWDPPQLLSREEGLALFEDKNLQDLDFWTLRFLAHRFPKTIYHEDEAVLRLYQRILAID